MFLAYGKCGNGLILIFNKNLVLRLIVSLFDDRSFRRGKKLRLLFG